jgi:hypothetical protein
MYDVLRIIIFMNNVASIAVVYTGSFKIVELGGVFGVHVVNGTFLCSAAG